MYLEFFGFAEKPFSITPNPRFIFLSKTHREVFAHLLYGIRNHAGFIEVIGEVGTGKTTVLRTLLGQLGGDGYRLAFIFNPSLSALELLRAVNREFGLASDGLSAGELLNHLNAFLLEENRAGRTVVLVIDEAQNLAPAVLEQIRLISNLETETDKLIQIVLVGQPELGRLLGRSELRQLAQRITVRYQLQPLDYDDTCAYVDHRLAVAGWSGGKIFTPDALHAIHRHSRGIPRLINVLCDRALVVAYGEERREVTAAMLAQARRELRRDDGRGARRWPRWVAAGALLGAIVASGVVLLRPASVSPVATMAVQSAESAGVPVGAPAPAAALSPLLTIWRVAPLPAQAPVVLPDGLATLAGERDLGVLRVRGALDTLLRLDTPALLLLRGEEELRYAALTGRSGERVRLEIAGRGAIWMPVAQLAADYSGEAYLFWRNPLAIPTRDGGWRGTVAASRLQRLLGLTPDGRFDDRTRAALLAFQRDHGLKEDGVPGPQTLLALYQEAGGYGLPRLSTTGEGL